MIYNPNPNFENNPNLVVNPNFENSPDPNLVINPNPDFENNPNPNFV